MPHRFAELAFTPAVIAAQSSYGSREANSRMARFGGPNDRLGPDEVEFLEGRDSFYMATITENGWPYVQHRGGPKGFLRALDEKTIAFADFRGNTQLISTGNLSVNDRVALFLADYPRKTRLKILGHAKVSSASEDPDLLSKLELQGYTARIERLVVITVEAFDWNCQQHITPRYTKDELRQAIAPLLARIERLEKENASLKRPSDT
jgi:predicted pyridoxine 5'-phosphate oxidase superfamily flavin-nucleotide-binding protein